MSNPVKNPQSDQDFAIQIIRTVSARLGLIREEVNEIGLALSQGRTPPNDALRLVEEIAPGCATAVSLSMYEGLTPQQRSGA